MGYLIIKIHNQNEFDNIFRLFYYIVTAQQQPQPQQQNYICSWVETK